MKRVLIVVVLAILSALGGCTSPVIVPAPQSEQPAGAWSEPASEEPSQQADENGESSPDDAIEQPATQESLVTVALDYFGLRDTHWVPQFGGDPLAKVQLLIVVSDDSGVLATRLVPPAETPLSGFDMDFFQVRAITDFTAPEIYSGAVTGAVTLCVAAYNVNKGPITKAQIDFVANWSGVPDFASLKALVPDKELLGYFLYTWPAPSDSWMERIDERGEGDLRVWMRIGSNQMPEAIQTPVLKPDITIENVKLPTGVAVRQPYSDAYVTTEYPFEFTIVNNESFDLPVCWKLISTQPPQSDSEDVVRTYGKRVIVNGKSKTTIRRDYWFSEPGAYDWQYILECPEGCIVDSWTGTLNVQAVKGGLSELPPGTYEVEVGYSSWPASSGAPVVWERYLSAEEQVQATVEWLGNQAVVWEWRFRVWGPAQSAAPTNNVAYTWSGKDLKKSFSFTPDSDGIYRIEILKRDYTARAVRLTVDPIEWETWPD